MSENDFNLASLADFLHLIPHQVDRMANRGQIPGRRIAGQWRFSQAEIHHWLEDRIGASDENQLKEVEVVLSRGEDTGCEPPLALSQLLATESIAIPLLARTRNSVIQNMVDLAAETGSLWDPAKMADAVRARENLHPTALDNGVALLHPRRPLGTILAEPILALGRTHQGIPFGGGALTDIFFLLCSVDDRGHLHLLARVSRLVGDPEFVAGLRSLGTAQEAHELIRVAEKSLPA